ncbi:MAG: stage III sporulation protein AA [Bacillota bacterium]
MSERERIEREVIRWLPENLRRLVADLGPDLEDLEEIRLRRGRPLAFTLPGRNLLVDWLVTADDIERTLQIITRGSLYAVGDELCNAFLTLPGGHRVGLAGRTVLQNGEIRALKEINGVNVRISREVPGAADHLLPHLIRPSGGAHSTLVLSPPGCGKTTLLRDLARQLANGRPGLTPGLRVGIVDERSELAACCNGVPQRDVGLRTDVMDGCPKARGIVLMIRSLSPEVIITDEVGRLEDVEALLEAANAGVAVIASAHAYGVSDARQRPSLGRMLQAGLFQRLVALKRQPHPGTVAEITDGQGNPLRRPVREVTARP